MKIVPYQPVHGREVARLHRLALPLGFLSHLGDRFLAELYRAIGQAPGSGVWVALDEEGTVMGFVSGTADVKRCYKEVIWGDWFRLGTFLLPNLWSLRTWRRLVETLVYPFQSSAQEKTTDEALGLRGELLSIAVSEAARGQGIGRKLLKTLESALNRWGYEGEYRVVTYAADPRSNSFYLALGYHLAGEFQHHDHMMAVYSKPLGSVEFRAPEVDEA